jgi:hypothetical protein
MSKWFEISPLRLLIAAMLFCVGVGILVWMIANADPINPGLVRVLATGALIGGAFGVLIRWPITCTVVGALLAVVVALIVCFLHGGLVPMV